MNRFKSHLTYSSILMRKMGLEPTRYCYHKILSLARLPVPTLPPMQEKGLEPSLYCYNRHLKPARLPIPPFLRTTDILPAFWQVVNKFLNIFINKYFFFFQTSLQVLFLRKCSCPYHEREHSPSRSAFFVTSKAAAYCTAVYKDRNTVLSGAAAAGDSPAPQFLRGTTK